LSNWGNSDVTKQRPVYDAKLRTEFVFLNERLKIIHSFKELLWSCPFHML